jgi:hypothetical protein
MKEKAMALSPEDLEQVGTYVKSHLPDWLPGNVINLSERITRVESELVSQRQLMREGFDNMQQRFEDMQHTMDKRFEDLQHTMDKRFEDLQQNMDKRFNVTQWFMATGFAAVIVAVTVLQYLS